MSPWRVVTGGRSLITFCILIVGGTIDTVITTLFLNS